MINTWVSRGCMFEWSRKVEKNLDLSVPLIRLSGSLRQGAVLREQFSTKERQRLPDTTPSFFHFQERQCRLPLTIAISSAVSTLIYSKHRSSTGERTLVLKGTIEFNFICQSVIGSLLDFQSDEAHYTSWVPSALS